MEISIRYLPPRICFRELVVRWSLSMFLAASVSLSGAPLAMAGQDCTESDISFMPLRDFNRFLVHYSSDGDRLKQLEAQIAGDLALWGQGDVAKLACRSPTEWSWTNHAYASFLLHLRMLYSEDSAPVPPPSFMPKFTFQRIGLSGSGRSMVITNLTFAHHSNGQAGCPLEAVEDQQQSGADVCPQPEPSAPELDINVSTGNFSTHYGRAGLYYQWTNMGNLGFLLGGAIEYHLPTESLGGSLSEALRARYGPTRADATLGVGFWQLSVRGSLQHVLNDGVKNPTTKTLEVFYHMRGLPDALAFYVRGYDGRDYYNINFERPIRRIEFGVTFSWQAIAQPGGI